MGLCGISSRFQLLSPSLRQVPHALLTRSPRARESKDVYKRQVLKRLEDAKLRQDYEAALKTLDSIPPEVIRFYENRKQEPAMRPDK